MRTECTDLFYRYREVARLVWNLGFYPDPKLRDWGCVHLYRDAMLSLFEGIVLHSVDCTARITDEYSPPGLVATFEVEVKSSEVDLRVDKNLPGSGGRLWGYPTLKIEPGLQKLRFIGFFEWDKLATQDLSLLEVRIEQLDARPELVGHHALIDMNRCSIFFTPD